VVADDGLSRTGAATSVCGHLQEDGEGRGRKGKEKREEGGDLLQQTLLVSTSRRYPRSKTMLLEPKRDPSVTVTSEN